MDTLFEPLAVPLWTIADSEDRYPINRIFCVGRNYAAHAREMGKDPDRDPPFFFTKWPNSYVPSGAIIDYPPATQNYHFEVELVVAIGREGFDIREEEARNHVFGYAVGLDMTRRDLQLEARDKGRPWSTGKNFDASAPLGPLHAAERVGHVDSGRIALTQNGDTRQEADLSHLIWSVEEIIAHLSRLYTLRPGDIIMTGTPAGVGPVESGDALVGTIEGLGSVELAIA